MPTKTLKQSLLFFLIVTSKFSITQHTHTHTHTHEASNNTSNTRGSSRAAKRRIYAVATTRTRFPVFPPQLKGDRTKVEEVPVVRDGGFQVSTIVNYR